jgi:hypothetical protein
MPREESDRLYHVWLITVRSLIFKEQELIKPYRASNPRGSIDLGIFGSHRAFAIL